MSDSLENRQSRSEREQCTLYISSAHCASAEEALRSLPQSEDRPFILIYTPNFCGFTSIGNPLSGDETFRKCADGSDVEDADDIFEMRCFCRDFDMRWVRTDDGGGIATVISESENCVLPSADVCKKYEHVENYCEHYILWGSGSDDGHLFEYRTGRLPVPAETKKGERVMLNFIEYFTPDERYGNMLFLAERLTGLA